MVCNGINIAMALFGIIWPCSAYYSPPVFPVVFEHIRELPEILLTRGGLLLRDLVISRCDYRASQVTSVA